MKEPTAKKAFITGAASGLGLAFARQLAQQGWHVGLTDIREEALSAIVPEIEAAGAGGIQTFIFDVADRSAFRAASERFLSESGGIDLLINNAGVGDGGNFAEYKLQDWDWLMGINFMGVVHGCHFFVPALCKQRRGIILNIASAAAFANGPGMSAYNASKAAVRSLSETLRYEMAPFDVQVSVAMPTFFRTNVMQFARGPQSARNFAGKMIERSGYDAQPIAAEILQKTWRGEAEIILPREARRLYRIRKWFANLYARRAREAARKALK